MKERITDKIKEIEEYLSEFEEIIPKTFEQYKNNNIIIAACERYFEKIVEALVDLTFLIIKHKNLKIPKEDNEAFMILSNEKVITEDLAKRLKDAKGMRNIITHEYGKLDNELVYESISSEIISDTREFIKEVRKNEK